MYQNANKVHKMTLMAILVAIILLLTFTPLGYLVVGPIAATTIQMPVIIGAALMGPVSGAVLGLFFGLSAILKVITMPGADVFASTALATAPLHYLLVCIGSRVLMGWFTGLLASGLYKIPALRTGGSSVIRYGVTGFVGSMLNTVFYLGMLWLLCAQLIASANGIDVGSVGGVVMTMVIGAGIPEAIVSCIVVTAVCKALSHALSHRFAV